MNEYETVEKYHDIWPVMSQAICNGLRLDEIKVPIVVKIGRGFSIELCLDGLRAVDPEIIAKINYEEWEIRAFIKFSAIPDICKFEEVQRVGWPK